MAAYSQRRRSRSRWLKIAGAAFLIWIGMRMVISALRQSGGIGEGPAGPAGTVARAFRTEAITAGGNPKTILIFAAFLPQFVPASGPAAFIEVGALFLLLEFCAIAVYASVGAVASLKLAARGGRWITGMLGIAMIGFGAALAFVEAPAQRR
ncbi:MAG: LysE family transporter [Pseudomonadota bacterium]